MAQTLANTITLIRNDLGFHDNLAQATITATMDRVQRRFETGADSFPLPWFCFDPDATVTTTTDQRYVNFPSDFVSFDESWPLTVVNADGETKDFERKPTYFLQRYRDKTGFPEAYDFMYDKLFAYPLPDAAYTINFPYYKRLSALSGVTTSPWLDFAEELLISETVLILAGALRDDRLQRRARETSKVARAEYIRKCEAQRHVLKQYTKGGVNA